jgi:hypothetical protein
VSSYVSRLVGLSAVALITLAPSATIAKDRVTVTLSATVLSTDGELHATIRVDPQDENRLLNISLDGPFYFASTDKQLDGASSARVHDIWWRHIPPGDYVVKATVEAATGRKFIEERHMKVIGGPGFPGQ